MERHFLDSQDSYCHDPSGMLRHLHDIPKMYADAWNIASKFILPPSYQEINKIVVLGMGGSAIGADMVAGMNCCRVPITVHRGYHPPPFIDIDTLVVASSYSGSTEETITAFEQVLATPAKKLTMTTGGILAELSLAAGVPCFQFNYRSPPRAALPYSLMPFLCILSRLGLMNVDSNTAYEAISVISTLTEDIEETRPFSENLAKMLAQELFGKICVFYGGEFLAEVARRWKLQVNENAKGWADSEPFPELGHNAVVGYRFPTGIQDRLAVVMLDSRLLDERIRLRYPITGDLLKNSGVAYQIVTGSGESMLAQMLSLITLGDYVSYYLALLNRIDPYPLDEVDYLKRALSNHNIK
jgi:glucose/mannose-6-phosphate isomerase